MELEQPQRMMPKVNRKPTGFRALWTRLLWQWYRVQGWRIEGPFSNHSVPSLLLLGPGLERSGLWSCFVEMRIGHRCPWWSPTMVLGNEPHVLCSFEKNQLLDTLHWAAQHGIQIQLVQRDVRHRKLRCNTPIQPGNHPSRLRDYVVRMLHQ